MLKKILYHSLIYGLSPHISKLATLFILPLLTANLTELDYGVSGLIISYMGIFVLFETLGMRLVLVNSFYHHTNHFLKRWGFIYGFLKLWVVIFSIFNVLILFLIIPEKANDNFYLLAFLISFPKLLFGSEKLIFSTYHHLNENPIKIGIRSFILGLIGVSITYITIVELKMGYMGWFWSTFITEILGGFSYWINIKYTIKVKPIIVLKLRLIKNFLKITLPTIPHNYSVFLLDASDRLVMDLTDVSTQNIGKYNFAYSFANYFSFFTTALSLAIGPIMNRSLKNNNLIEYKVIIFSVQLLLFNLTFIFSLFCKEIFSILVDNHNLATLYPLTIILVMSYNYRPQYLAVSVKLFFYEKTAKIWKISFTSGIINVILNFLLIPIFGFEIAALTTFFSLLLMGYSGYLSSDFKSIKPNIKFYPIFWLICQLVLTFLAYSNADSSFVIKLVLSSLLLIPSFIYIIKNKGLLLN